MCSLEANLPEEQITPNISYTLFEIHKKPSKLP